MDGRVVAVDPDQPLPFGADRALLGWIQTLAYRSPQIRFRRLTEFFRAFGLSDSGREYRVFHQRLARLRGLAISVQLASADGDRHLTMHPIKRSFLPGREEAQRLLGAPPGARRSSPRATTASSSTPTSTTTCGPTPCPCRCR